MATPTSSGQSGSWSFSATSNTGEGGGSYGHQIAAKREVQTAVAR